ncbi:tyrosine-type recombinase/integrase [Nocardioides sp. LHG3406-4]|uniref:tyrosine-type recombinase/integrase n=1 Tax=Nocardioides sp. LHG3406-4 TaxID=2804575 RepID=UPI003CF1373E
MSKQRNDGDGSVYQVHVKDCPRPKGPRGKSTCACKWRGAVVVGYKRNAKGAAIAVRKTRTANTESGCAAKVRDLRAELAKVTLPVGKSPTVEQWLNHCHATVLPRQKKKPRESTLAKYRYCFDQYLIPLLGHIRLDKLDPDDIEAAWHHLAEIGNPMKGPDATPLDPTTVHWAHTILSRMLRLAMQKRMLAANPAGPDAMDAPAKSDKEVVPLPTEDWRKVLAAAVGTWNAARWTVALAMGLRQGEALALRWEDIDLDGGSLRVRQTVFRLKGKGLVFGPPKTERSKREVALPAPLVAELRKHRREQNERKLLVGDKWRNDLDLVFTYRDGGVIDGREDRKAWHALLEKAGVAPLKLHAARHTAATMMLLQGIDPRVVMDIMGWSQVSTASNYRHAVDEAKRTAADKIGAAVWG